MNGRTLALASLAGLAVAGVVRRRGAPVGRGSRDATSGWAYHVTGRDRLAGIARDGLQPYPGSQLGRSGSGVAFVSHFGVVSRRVDPASTAWLRFPWPASARAIPGADPGPEWAHGWTMDGGVDPVGIEILVDSAGRPVHGEDLGTWVALRDDMGSSNTKSISTSRRAAFNELVHDFGRWTTGLLDEPTGTQLCAWAMDHGIEYLGSGSWRVVFGVREGAIKFGDTPGGVRCNLREARVAHEAPDDVRRHLVPVLASAGDGSWILMERVTPAGRGATLSDTAHLALSRYGIEDLGRTNFAADGRLFDYGNFRMGTRAAQRRQDGS